MQKVVTIERISNKVLNLIVKEKDTGKLYDLPAYLITSYEQYDGDHIKTVESEYLKPENEVN
jgi:hypothetical protein